MGDDEEGRMKCLVTGGAGFIGSHIVDRLIQNGHDVVVLDDLSSGRREQVHSAARFYHADIREPGISAIFESERPDVVDHHAAQMDVRRSVRDPQLDISINIAGTVNLLRCCVQNGVNRVVFASSGGAVYGEPQMLPVPESHARHAACPYGINKGVAEEYLRYFYDTTGLQSISLRYGNVYGPRQNPHGEAGVVAIFLQKLLDGEPVTINGTGQQTRDFVYVDDVVEANMAAMDFPDPGHAAYNVGTGQEADIVTIYQALAAEIAPAMEPQYGPAKPGEQNRIALDCRKIAEELGWKPKTSLQEGLTKTVHYTRGIYSRLVH
jgi:UDP-glucose 4-epimerase